MFGRTADGAKVKTTVATTVDCAKSLATSRTWNWVLGGLLILAVVALLVILFYRAPASTTSACAPSNLGGTCPSGQYCSTAGQCLSGYRLDQVR